MYMDFINSISRSFSFFKCHTRWVFLMRVTWNRWQIIGKTVTITHPSHQNVPWAPPECFLPVRHKILWWINPPVKVGPGGNAHSSEKLKGQDAQGPGRTGSWASHLTCGYTFTPNFMWACCVWCFWKFISVAECSVTVLRTSWVFFSLFWAPLIEINQFCGKLSLALWVF